MIELSQSDIQKLKAKVSHEYQRAEQHTRTWKEEVKDYGKNYLLPKSEQDKIKVRKVLNNLNIRLATFVSDEVQVNVVPNDWVLGKDNAQNADKVFKYLFDSMRVRNKYREAIISDALTWVWVLAIDGWNNHKQEPILSYVDSRLTFPDPKNWQDNTMTFFGTKVRKSWYELENDKAYDQERLLKCKMYVDIDQQEVQRSNNDVKDFNEDLGSNENETDLYNHLTIFKAEWDEKACVYLTTWGNNLWEIVRCIKMRPLTEWEEADPSTIDFGVQLFRAKPLPWSYAGASLVDDVGQYQDMETLMTNLLIRQAKEAGLRGKTYVNEDLGIDVDLVAELDPWTVVPFKSADPNINAQNGIFQEPTLAQNPIITNSLQLLNNLSEEADPSGSAIAQGQATPGSQTKAEIQTLQKNINQVLSYMASNYMDALKDMWTSVYRSFQMNMSPQRKKDIVLSRYGEVESYWFKKSEFISKWEVYLSIKSKAQEDIKKKQDFAVLLSVISILKASVTPWSYQDTKLNRLLVEKSGVSGVDKFELYGMTRDERQAYEDVESLNRNEKVAKPQPWEDHELFIYIYKKGLKTPARDLAIFQREQILLVEPKQKETPQAWGGGEARQLGASMLAGQQANQTPSLSDVTT